MFYVTEQISPRIGKTPDGFLVCYDVPIARTGKMVYNKAQADVMPWLNKFEGDSQGNIYIERTEDEVFSPATIASFEGKPVTIDHPDSLVSPETWKELTKGTVQNIRRGEQEAHDLLLSDLIIGDQEAIEYVESGELRQISCGYDAEYEQLGPDRGKQTSIIGNHVALVQHGRAGLRCMIMDSHQCTGCGKCHKNTNKEVNKMSLKDKIKQLFNMTLDGLKDEDLKEAQVKDSDPIEEKIVKALDCWWKKTKDAESEEEKKKEEEKAAADKKTKDAEEEEKKKEEEEKNKTGDKAYFADMAARAEILSPGYKMPTYDSPDAKKDIKRSVLEASYKTDDGKAAIEPFTGGPVTDWSKLSAATVDAAYIGASELLKQKNNSSFNRIGLKVVDFQGPISAAEINKRNREFNKAGRA